MSYPKYVLCNVFLFGVLVMECIMISRGHWFHPIVDRLEPRAMLAGTTDGVALDQGEMAPEMPNGVEAFVPENSASIDLLGLIPDVLGNFPGDPNYLSGRPPEIPADAPDSDNALLPFWQGVAP
jgi:hypothetical protein